MFNEDRKQSASVVAPSTYSGERIFVVSIGGSVIVDKAPNPSMIAKICEAISNLHSDGYKFALVVGGGKTAGDYVAASKTLGASNFCQDEIGIAATRLNAMLIIESLEKAHATVLTDIKASLDIIESGEIPVYGGLIPGYTTDSVAALLAEFLHARFVNLSNVKGIFAQDPKENPRATFYPKISHDRLLRILLRSSQAGEPRANLILDIPACLILKRSNIDAFFVSAKDLNNLSNAIRGAEFEGTLVTSGAPEAED
jgi:uridylate kinase